jgi:hypothetical protein
MRTELDLSGAQQDTLRILLDGGATSLETALNAYNSGGPRLNANVLARLEAKGLTLSKVKTARGGSRMTHYWLTLAGAERAASIAASARAG